MRQLSLSWCETSFYQYSLLSENLMAFFYVEQISGEDDSDDDDEDDSEDDEDSDEDEETPKKVDACTMV